MEAQAGVLTKIGAGAAGFDFTKLGTDGLPLSIQNGTWSDSGTEASGTKWSCVRDNHTGLVWEVKVNDINDLRNKYNGYSWYNPDFNSNGNFPGHQCPGGICDTHAYVQAINSLGLCGYKDWHVPNVVELQSILHYDRVSPVIDTGFFPNIESGLFWSSSSSDFWTEEIPYGTAMLINFTDGTILIEAKDFFEKVLLVR